jgi:altronate hydrolase
MDFVRLDRADTVVTATRSLSPGCEIEQIATRSAIPSGHKVATQAMAAGDAGAQICSGYRLCFLRDLTR